MPLSLEHSLSFCKIKKDTVNIENWLQKNLRQSCDKYMQGIKQNINLGIVNIDPRDDSHCSAYIKQYSFFSSNAPPSKRLSYLNIGRN